MYTFYFAIPSYVNRIRDMDKLVTPATKIKNIPSKLSFLEKLKRNQGVLQA